MAEKRKTKFARTLGKWDIAVVVFGAMIGWGWVVSSGGWIETGGAVGAALGFIIGGIMIFFVGRTYAELTSAMPQCGGEHVFCHKAMGTLGSFISTWAIILGYVSVVCFESCTLPMILSYLWPGFLQGYLYTVAGFDIYVTQLVVAIAAAILITYINIRGTKLAANVQAIFTIILAAVGILLVAASVFTGDVDNLGQQAFIGDDFKTAAVATMTVAMVTPFFFIGFDVIPQVAEEISVSLKKIGIIMLVAVTLAALFYASIIVAIGLVLTPDEIVISMNGTGLVTADAMAKAFSSTAMAKVALIGGLCGIITSWNSFMIGGSRSIYSMGESYMIPRTFGKLHKKYNTPVNALLMIGILSIIAPFFGRKMLTWIVDAGNFGCCLAYFMVVIAFLLLRKKAPDMERPYTVKRYKLVGAIALVMSGFMVVMYIIPGTGASLSWEEWIMVGGWIIAGVIASIYSKLKYKEKYGDFHEVLYENPEGESKES